MDRDQIVNHLAAGQHALVTTAQLLEIGLSQRVIDGRVHQGRFERVHRGVFRIAGAPKTFEQEVMAGCLAVGGLVAASHRCAAHLWRLDLGACEVPVELTLAARRAPAPTGVQVHRSVDLTASDIVRLHRVPVTHPHRLLVDLGAVVPQPVVGWCLDDLVSRKVVTIAGVRATLDRVAARGRSGVSALRAELDERGTDEPTRSRLEAMLLALAKRCGLPAPVFQYPILLGGRRRRIDFAFPELRIAIEVDGYEFHSRLEVFEDDRVRGNELELAGWTVLHFTWKQLRQRPDYVERVLRRALGLAA